jgi:hypothetical protein
VFYLVYTVSYLYHISFYSYLPNLPIASLIMLTCVRMSRDEMWNSFMLDLVRELIMIIMLSNLLKLDNFIINLAHHLYKSFYLF